MQLRRTPIVLALIAIVVLWSECRGRGPGPASGIAKAAVVYEAMKGTMPDYVYLARDKAIGDGLVPPGQFLVIDVNEASRTADHSKEAVAAAEANGLPALVVLGEGDSILRVVDLPPSLDAIIEALQ